MNGLLVIDDFLPDPDMVRKYALSIKYTDNTEKEKGTTFPGKRSAVIAEINPEYNLTLFNKLSKLIYNVDDSSYSIDIKSQFQIVHGRYGRGWVHADGPNTEVAGVLYLNKNPPINSGTEFYKIKKLNNDEDFNFDGEVKKQFVTNNISYADAEASLLRNNSQYELADYISNKHNRLILYPADWLHCARDYFGDTDENARLTQVFFINCISHNSKHKYFLDKIRSIK